MPHQPALLLLDIRPHHLLLVLPIVSIPLPLHLRHHPPDLRHHGRREHDVAQRRHRAVRVPPRDLGRLELPVQLEPARREGASKGRGQNEAGDDAGAGGDEVGPEVREWAAGEGVGRGWRCCRFGGGGAGGAREEGHEKGVLEDGEGEGGGGGTQGMEEGGMRRHVASENGLICLRWRK